MKYKEIIEPYIAKLKEATPEERIDGIQDLFIELKSAGFKKADINDNILALVDKVATDSRLPEGKRTMLRIELNKSFMMTCSILEKGEAVAKKPEIVKNEEKEEFDENDDEEINKRLSKMKPEDFKKKETDWEFMESVGMARVDDPDIGDPHE